MNNDREVPSVTPGDPARASDFNALAEAVRHPPIRFGKGFNVQGATGGGLAASLEATARVFSTVRFRITTPPDATTLGMTGLPAVAQCKIWDGTNTIGYEISVKVIATCAKDLILDAVLVYPQTDLTDSDGNAVVWIEKVDNPMRFGKVLSDTSSGNVVPVTPLTAYSGVASGEATVNCYVVWPATGTPPPFSLKMNDVLAYIPVYGQTNLGTLLPIAYQLRSCNS